MSTRVLGAATKRPGSASTPLQRIAGSPETCFVALGLLTSIPMWALHLPCPFREATGLWCPMCGATRCVVALVRLEPAAAVRDNALLVLILAVLLTRTMRLLWTRTSLFRATPSRVTRPGIVVMVLLTWCVVRNLPGCSYLVPVR